MPERLKNHVAFVEQASFPIFNFPVLNGSNSSSLSTPNTSAMTNKPALSMFVKTDMVGNTFVSEND
jgi:hypothetical protein